MNLAATKTNAFAEGLAELFNMACLMSGIVRFEEKLCKMPGNRTS